MTDTTTKYWIRSHVYACATEDTVIFLDTKRDQYYGFNGMHARAISSLMHGWALPDITVFLRTPAESEVDILALENQLLAHGLVTTEKHLGKSPTPAAVSKVHMIKPDEDTCAVRSIRAKDVLNFVTAYSISILSLRFRRLQTVIDLVRRRKEVRSPRMTFNTTQAAELTSVYRRMQIFFFSERDRCLLNSLVLLNFLARYDLYPTWVIGVRSDPFMAHSWLQHEHTVLSGDPEFVDYFTPIFAA